MQRSNQRPNAQHSAGSGVRTDPDHVGAWLEAKAGWFIREHHHRETDETRKLCAQRPHGEVHSMSTSPGEP